MPDFRYTYENIEFYDCNGIACRLEQMAARGWMIEKITGKFYKYRKIQPQQLKFAVTYAPKVTAYDLSPTLAQRNYLEICEEYGWQPALLHNRLQIMYNEDTDAVEIETDGTNMLDNIHATAKKTFIPQVTAHMLSGLGIAVTLILNFIASPMDFICTSYCFPALLFGFIGAINDAIDLVSYFKWYKAAVVYRSTTDRLLPAKKNGMLNIIFKALLLFTVLWVVIAVLSGVYRKIFTGIIIVILLSNIVSEFLIKDSKEMGKSAGDVKFTALFFSMLVFIIGCYGVITMDSNVVEKVDGAYVSEPEMVWTDPVMDKFTAEEKAYIAKMYGDMDVSSFIHLIWFPAEYEDVENKYSHIFPLEMADYNHFVEERGEFFYRNRDYGIVDYTDARQQSGSYKLQYSIYYPEKPFYNLVLYAVKRTEIPNVFYRNKHPQTDFSFKETDSSLWQADKVYQLTDYQGYKTGTYLLCKDNRIIKLHLESPNILTEDAIRNIARKLEM